jgi:DNA-binding transcriptional ArsR family regulator
MDLVFKALADASRRSLLDNLFSRDGQTLGELGSGLEMTRFGAMKHLRVLENAGLVTTLKVGRRKLHYLNPVPIQEIHERWVSKYAAPWLSTIGAIKTELEGEAGRPLTPTAIPSRGRRAASGQAQSKRRIRT